MKISHKVCWADWALMACMLAIAAVFIAVTGCGSTDFPCGAKVLIFHAKWCRWCPTSDEIDELQSQFPNCEVVVVDIDEHPDLKAEYHVTKVPRFFLCDDSGCQATTNFDELRQWLEDL